MTVLIFSRVHIVHSQTYFMKMKIIPVGKCYKLVLSWVRYAYAKRKFFEYKFFCEIKNGRRRRRRKAFVMTPLSRSQLSSHQVFQSSLKCRQFNKNMGEKRQTMKKKYILLTQSIINITLDVVSVSMNNNIQHENVLYKRQVKCSVVIALFCAFFVAFTLYNLHQSIIHWHVCLMVLCCKMIRTLS